MREDGSLYGSEDFQLIPGRGYLLKSNHDYLIGLRGLQVVDSVPISLSQAGILSVSLVLKHCIPLNPGSIHSIQILSW